MNSPALSAGPKHGLKISGVEKALRQRVPGTSSRKPTIVQKEQVSRRCGWSTESISTSKPKAHPIKITEHI